MITGTSEADVAVLVVASASGAFEAGLSKNGLTREHIVLSYTLGVKQTNIGVNKMDQKTVNCSQNRNNEIKTETSRFRQRIGFNPVKTPPVPLSFFPSDNMIEQSKDMP